MTRQVEVSTDIPADAWGDEIDHRRVELLEDLRTKVAEAGWDLSRVDAEVRVDPAPDNMVRMTMTARVRR